MGTSGHYLLLLLDRLWTALTAQRTLERTFSRVSLQQSGGKRGACKKQWWESWEVCIRLQALRAVSSKDHFLRWGRKRKEKKTVGEMKNVQCEKRPSLPQSGSIWPLAVGSRADSWWSGPRSRLYFRQERPSSKPVQQRLIPGMKRVEFLILLRNKQMLPGENEEQKSSPDYFM